MSPGNGSKATVSAVKKNASSSIPRRDSTSSPITTQITEQKKKKGTKQQAANDEIVIVQVDEPSVGISCSNKKIFTHRDPEATFKCGECDIAQFPVLRIIPHNSPVSA